MSDIDFTPSQSRTRNTQPQTNPAGQWLSRYTASAAGTFTGGALLLVALYFLVAYQINKTMDGIEKGWRERETTPAKRK